MKLLRRARLVAARQARDLLAIAGIGSIALGLGFVNVTLALLAVGVFLLVAASSGRRPA